VPAVAEAAATGNAGRRAGTASKAVLFAAIAGFGAASLFVFFPNELGQVIYKQSIGWMLTFMGVMCPLIYIQIVLAGILNGLGMQVFIFRNSLISSGINIAFIYFLIPRFGLAAFIAGWLVSLIIVVALELHKVRENLTLNIAFANWFAKPALAALMSGVAARVLYDQLLREIAGNTVGLMISVCALLGMFMLSVMLTGCLVKEDVRRLIKIRVK
ncbi:MAG: polysaccharide biosynthesis C-terminal domain-containing protein, partial [Clostridiales bacterium]|jgi:stage V sporulation protein B|nr:polysaccharide biosynthesis C-terminal domain-containing protein [Clostridiales bacterium]